jgi:hypothetical protein
MSKNLNIPDSKKDTQVKNNSEDSLTQNSTCYRGFTSIDQEMEREIAMQWFKPVGKSRSFHATIFFRGRS